MMRNIQEALTTIKNKARVRTCRNKPQVSSSGGTSTQIDAITALTKQVEALEYHFASMRETYDQNQEAAFQLIQNQMGQMAEDLQESPLGVLPSNTVTDPLAELNVITSMDGLTLDGSFTPHSNFLVYQEEKQEPKTITKVVEISSSKSTPLVPPPETPPLSTPKPKENLEPNPHQPLIPYPSRLKEEKFQALKNPTGRADHFVYRIDIVDSLCDKFPIENNSMSGNPTPSSDSMVESPSPSLIPYEDSDSLLEETDTLLSHFILHLSMRLLALILKRKVVAVPLLILIILFRIMKLSILMTIILKRRVVAVPLLILIFLFLNMIRLSLIFRLIRFLLPIGVFLIMRSSPMNSLISYLHLSMTIFYFDLEIVPGEFTRVLEENIFDLSTKGLTINELNDSSLLLSDCDSSLSKEFPEINLLVSFPSGNEDMIFDPEIFIIKRVQSKRFQFFPLDDFPTFSFVSDSLLLIRPSEIETFLSFPFGNEDKVFDQS
ncbi:hypothetical protein Tco_0705782 [Tanacetum coccineum]|uniref:Reverse transcriptase domain-containing protein n=1 Tax=Tanacetum coccineum TaxID=301880 RepID=A0ABQ4Y5N8_9ASTR